MGTAYLKDGTRMDYKEYIASHPHWQVVRQARLKFDNQVCVICHKPASMGYETHHVNYDHLGDEHMTDVITLCKSCHAKFHSVWRKQDFWKGREKEHWQLFDIEHTARLCAVYYNQDKFISCNPNGLNLCSKDTQRQIVDEYLKELNAPAPIQIDPNDIGLFVRNKRYELFFEAESRGLTVEQFLDERYGPKERGKNPLRQEAGKKNGTFDHEPKSFHRHYKENKNILALMEEAKKYYPQED